MSTSPDRSPSVPLPGIAAGTDRCPYKLAIIGGGPSGCSIIVRATRIGLVSELCGYSFIETSPGLQATPYLGGVCLIDKGSMQRLGGGTLQDYVINSNTYIGKFVTNVVNEKADNLPPEHTKHTLLEGLGAAPSAKELERYGNRTGPLDSVGAFLRDVGQAVVSILQAYPSSSRHAIGSSAEALQQVLDENGMFSHWKITLSRAADGSSETIYAKHVALATGGHQEAPRFPGQALSAKVMVSDLVCTAEGVEIMKARIRRNLRAGGSGKVAIVGGSHSAFSAAWVCLHKVDETADKKTMGNSSPKAKASSSTDPRIVFGGSSICILHRSPVKVFYATKAEADRDQYNDSTVCVNRVTGNINPFGGIRGDAKELWARIRQAKEGRVRMLQVRSNIGHALATNANEAVFGGMKQSIVDKVLEEAAVIVWACGYSTNLLAVLDSRGQSMSIAKDKGQVSVDDQARVLSGDVMEIQMPSPAKRSGSGSGSAAHPPACPVGPVVENLYGSGLGYGLRAVLDNGEPDGASGRADGVAVYLKRGATLVLAHVLGDKVFGGMGIRSWEERNTLMRKQALARGRSSEDSSDDEDEDGRTEADEEQASPRRLPIQTDKSPNTKRSITRSASRGKFPENPLGIRNSFNGHPSSPSSSSGQGTSVIGAASVSGGSGSAKARPLSTGRAMLMAQRAAAKPASTATTAVSSRCITPHSNRSTPKSSCSTPTTLAKKPPIGAGTAPKDKDHLNLVKRLENVVSEANKIPAIVPCS